MADAMSIAGRVLDALVTAGAVTADQVAAARAETLDDAGAGKALLDRGVVTESQLSEVR